MTSNMVLEVPCTALVAAKQPLAALIFDCGFEGVPTVAALLEAIDQAQDAIVVCLGLIALLGKLFDTMIFLSAALEVFTGSRGLLLEFLLFLLKRCSKLVCSISLPLHFIILFLLPDFVQLVCASSVFF